MGKEKESKRTITYTVAECSEFHELGEYHENIRTISEAKWLFDRIDPGRMHGIPAIGINIHTGGHRTMRIRNGISTWEVRSTLICRSIFRRSRNARR